MRKDNDSAYRFWLAVGLASGILAIAMLASCLVLGP